MKNPLLTSIAALCYISVPTLPYGDKEPEKKKDKEDDKEEGEQQNQINPPKIDPETGKATQKAIANAKQAHSIAKGLKQRAVDGRLVTAATVGDKYNGAAPFNNDLLKATKQGWRNNFSTQVLPSVIDRVRPQFKDPLDKADQITYSSLPSHYQDAAVKSRKFCEGITKLIRGRSGWDDFVNGLTQDEILHGNAAPAFLDDSWMPVFFGYGDTFLPEGTGQHAKGLQTAVFAQQMLIHEFMDKIRDPEAAKDAYYNLPECYKAANESAENAQKDETPLDRVDIIREQGVLNYSYANQQKTVDLFHVVQREYDGKIALWTVTQKTGYAVRHVPDLHPDSDYGMEDVAALFTLQTGSKKFYGSKGLGRLLANIVIALERGRCLAADMMHLSGLIVLQAEAKDFNTIQPRVVHPFVVLPKGIDISKEKIEFDATNYLALDAKLSALLEAIAGAFIPPNLENQGASNTTIEAAEKAARELAVRQGVLGRFFKQFADLISAMQRKICSPTNMREAIRIWEESKEKRASGMKVVGIKIAKFLKRVFGKKADAPKLHGQGETKIADQDAVNFIVDMLNEGLSPEEIGVLALAPSGNEVQNNTEQRDANTVGFIDANAQNPYLDHYEATKMKAEIAIGRDRADRILVKKGEDPNAKAGQVRLQLMELGMMVDGTPMPVDPTDDHVTHRKTLVGHGTAIFEALETAPTPELVAAGELMVSHYQEHLLKDPNTTEEQKAQESEGVKGWLVIVENAKKMLATLMQQLPPGTAPGGAPVPVGGQPMSATGPNGEIEGDRHAEAIDGAKAVAESAFRDREIKLKEKEQAHKQGLEEVRAAVDIAKTMTEIQTGQTKAALPGSQTGGTA